MKKKVRYLAGLAGIAPATVGFMAQATPANAATWSCFNKLPNGNYGWCNATIVSGPAKFYSHYYGFTYKLPTGDRVKVTCWYSGTGSGDPFWDHIVREKSITGLSGGPWYKSGHVADRYVSLGGYPYRLLNKC